MFILWCFGSPKLTIGLFMLMSTSHAVTEVGIPQAISTSLIVTMDIRELRHFFSLRCCNRAQWEIRELADKMFRECYLAAPVAFETAGPGCCNGCGCREDRPCGHPRSLKEILGDDT